MIRLVFLSVIVVLLSAGAFVSYTQPEVLPPQLQGYAPQIKSGINSGMGTIQTLLSNSKNAQPAVMGVKTESSRIFQEDTAGKPIHQKAMEFTQYQYCQMVVKSYEQEQAEDKENSSSISSSSATPSPTTTQE